MSEAKTAADERRRLLQDAMKVIDQLRGRVADLERDRAEPIAIVGVGCRFPGGATGPDAYWRMLQDGVDAIREVPRERWTADAYAQIDPATAARMPAQFGGFIEGIDQFDPVFFGISPREAVSIDPQHRLVLEIAWEALEHAGIAPDSLRGSLTGVFVGITASDYVQHVRFGDPESLDVYTATGNAHNAAAGRVSYTLGFNGPAMAVDTACSSSLTAIHLACQSLRLRESDLALAGGVNAVLLPDHFVSFFKWGMMAPDGRCKTFDAAADGFVRAEGCGLVVLKRLSDAVGDGDRVLAVIRGSAVNQDGASSGLTVPNGPAQEAVLRQALRVAGIAPADVSYVEAHGTGTTLGDPIEMEALDAVLGEGRDKATALLVGSVKTNLGHLESSAGVAGVIKTVLSLQNAEIPPHLHFERLSPGITLRKCTIQVPTARTPWPRTARPRVAGISSFGFSGTNAHVLVEEAPVPAVLVPGIERPLHLLTLSGKSEAGLRDLLIRYADLFDAQPELFLADAAFTAAIGRARLPHRVALIAGSLPEAAARLRALATGETPAGTLRGRARGLESPRVAFLFTGQGSQHAGMGHELYETQPTFRKALDRCAELLGPELSRPLLDVMHPRAGEASPVDETGFTQPALFALEWSLAELWRSFGIEPQAVMGHSVGEYVAACVAGVMSLEDALKLIAARGRLMQALPAGGAMAAVSLGEAKVKAALAGSRLSIAAVNGPDSVVISGPEAELVTVLARLTTDGVRSKRLAVSHAFHSSLMDPMLAELRAVASSVTFSRPRLTFVSNVTGTVAGDEVATAEYWVRHAREAVRFADGMKALWDQSYRVFLEVGPSPTLLGMARAVVGSEGTWLPSLRPGRSDWSQLLESLGGLYVNGVSIDWAGFDRDYARQKISLPTYPFQRQRYWVAQKTRPVEAPVTHPLLGRRVESALGATTFESRLTPQTPAFLADHRVLGSVLLPATGYLEIALAAAAEVLGPGPCEVENLTIAGSLEVPEDGTTLRSVVTHDASGVARIGIGQNASAALRAGGPPAPAVSLAELRGRVGLPVDVDAFYARFRRAGLEFGPAFRGLAELWRGAHESLGHLRAPVSGAGYRLHPALLDAGFQALAAARDGADDEAVFLPLGLDRLQVFGASAVPAWCHARLRPAASDETLTADLTFLDEAGAVVAQVEALRLKRARTLGLRKAEADFLYETQWPSVPMPAGSLPAGPVCVLADADGVAAALRERLSAAGLETTASPEAARTLVDLRALGAAAPVADSCVRLLKTVQALDGTAVPPRLVVVTRGGQDVLGSPVALEAAALWGLTRTLAAERPELRAAVVDLDPAWSPSDVEAGLLWAELAGSDRENQVAYRAGVRHAARLVPYRAPGAAEPSVALEIETRGILDGLHLVPAPRRAPGAGEVEVRVSASGMNFRDVLNAMGLYEGPAAPLGSEFAGTVVALGEGVADLALGDAVVGMGDGAFRSYVTAPAVLVLPKPEQLDFAEAATVPITFLTAEYALNRLAALKAGERVLIHAASGGVGLAALQLARRAGAEVFATAGSEEKRAFLRALGVLHVMDSRSLSFADEVRRRTHGQGVDVVLNSLTGEFIPESLRLLRARGRFLEIGKAGIWTREQMAEARPDVGYFAIYLGQVAPELLREMFASLLADMAAGTLAPLPKREFPLAAAPEAFRFMAQARHIGKVVLTQDTARPASGIRADASYLVTGGLGGLGLRTARWLVEAGARHVVLLGRGEPGVEAAREIARLAQDGAQLHVMRGDVTRAADVDAIVARIAAELPPLRGVFHAAGVLEDGVLSQQSRARFEAVLAPKAQGTLHLEAATRRLPLDFFVLFSSASAVLGSPGQGAYGAANAVLDGVAARRRRDARVATSVDWGPWSEVGMAAALDARDRKRWEESGVSFLSPAAAFAALESVTALGPPHLLALPVDWKRFLARFEADAVPPLFAAVAALHSASEARPDATGSRSDLRARLEAASPARRLRLLASHVRGETLAVLALDASHALDDQQGFQSLGMDSLMAVELRNRLQAAVGQPLPSTLAFDHPTVEAVVAFLAGDVLRLATPREEPAPETGAAQAAELAELDALSDSEAEALLLRELAAPGGDGQ